MRRMIALLMLISLVLFFAYLWYQQSGSAQPPLPKIVIVTPTIVTVSGPVILHAIRNQARLETVAMLLANDMDVNRVWGLQGACRESLTYLGYFTVTAGIDLQLIGDEDIQVVQDPGAPAAIRIALPPASILHTELDTARSRVVHHDASLLAQVCGTQLPEMVTQAQDDLRKIARDAALQKGILAQAQERASFELQRLLLEMGYSKVEIQVMED